MVCVVLAILVSMILFMKVRSLSRLNMAYSHVDKYLADQPAQLGRFGPQPGADAGHAGECQAKANQCTKDGLK